MSSQFTLHTAQHIRPLTAEDLEGDLIQPGHPLFGIVWINKQRMSGTPCFSGPRVPIKTLFDYVEGGEPLEEFLEDFEGVTREQAEADARAHSRQRISQTTSPCMNILFDHCVPKRLRWSLSHPVKTTREMGWERLRNGVLLAEAAKQCRCSADSRSEHLIHFVDTGIETR